MKKPHNKIFRKRSLSQDRHGESSSRNGPIRAKSERDLSRVAKVWSLLEISFLIYGCTYIHHLYLSKAKLH